MDIDRGHVSYVYSLLESADSRIYLSLQTSWNPREPLVYNV